MGRKKSDSAIEMAAVTFRLPADLKASLEDLAASARKDSSAILVELVGALVELNAQRISLFRQQAAAPIIMPTAITADPSPKTSEPAKTQEHKKPARGAKKKSAAQVNEPKQGGGDDVAKN